MGNSTDGDNLTSGATPASCWISWRICIRWITGNKAPGSAPFRGTVAAYRPKSEKRRHEEILFPQNLLMFVMEAGPGDDYRNLRIPSVAEDTSPLMVTVNLMLFRSPKRSSQFRNFSVSQSTSLPMVLQRLSINT